MPHFQDRIVFGHGGFSLWISISQTHKIVKFSIQQVPRQTNYSIMLKHVHPRVIVWIGDCGNVQVFCLELRSSRNNYHLTYTGKFQFSFKVQFCSCRIGQASPLQIFRLEEFVLTKLGIPVIGCYKLKVWYLMAFVADNSVVTKEISLLFSFLL